MQAGAAVPDKQPNNRAANIPTPKLAPVGAVPVLPSPSGVVSSGKATFANTYIPGKGAPSAAKALPAGPPAAGSNKVIHIVLQLLLCDALHGGECTAELVHQLISVLFKCAGHDGELASAHAYCYTTCSHAYICLGLVSWRRVVSAVRVDSCLNIAKACTQIILANFNTTCSCMNQAMMGTIAVRAGCSATFQEEPRSRQSCPEQAWYPQAWFRQTGGGWAKTWLNAPARPVQWQQASQVQRLHSPEGLGQEQPFG